MARETLPKGSSLLALAGSSLVAQEPSEPTRAITHPEGTSAISRMTAKEARGATTASPRLATGLRAENRRQKVNARISSTLLDEVRDCVVALSGPPHRMTMDQFAEEAYRRELDRLKRQHGGEAFERRPYNPRPGRRVA